MGIRWNGESPAASRSSYSGTAVRPGSTPGYLGSRQQLGYRDCNGEVGVPVELGIDEVALQEEEIEGEEYVFFMAKTLYSEPLIRMTHVQKNWGCKSDPAAPKLDINKSQTLD